MVWNFIEKRIKNKSKNQQWPYGTEQIKCEVCGGTYHFTNATKDGGCPLCENELRREQSTKDYEKFIQELEFKQKREMEIKEQEIRSEAQNPQYHFKQIIESIETLFIPQTITNEEHLQAQITIFLQTSFPNRKIEREYLISHGNRIDIMVDKKYAFEVKVPMNREDLRNLKSQLEEYAEDYPLICAIIFDNQELNLSQEIENFKRKYLTELGIPTIILSGKKR